MENKEKNSVLYKLLIITAIVVPLLIGTSYAYFLAVIRGTENPTNMAGTAVTSFVFDLVTANDGYIDASNVIPINDSDRYDYGNIGEFSVTTGANAYSVNYSLSLTDITISNGLKISDFKWELKCTSCANTNNDATGTFSSYSSGDLLLKNNLVIAPSSQEDYKLVIWLRESGSDQTNLMNLSFRAKVKATGEFLLN